MYLKPDSQCDHFSTGLTEKHPRICFFLKSSDVSPQIYADVTLNSNILSSPGFISFDFRPTFLLFRKLIDRFQNCFLLIVDGSFLLTFNRNSLPTPLTRSF